MKIVIDARESGTSTGRYVDKLVEHLNQLKPSANITVLTKTPQVDYLKSIAPRFNVIKSDYKEFTFDEQLGFKRQLKNLQPDLVHFGKDHQPILYRGKVITTMHDLTTARFYNPAKPWLVFKLKQLVYIRVVKRVAKKSEAILTGSQFVKEDIVRYTGVSPDKITVTYEAADLIKDAPEPIHDLLGKQFLMYIGRPTPHKNLERLIEAFSQLTTQCPGLLLVLAGKQDVNYQRIAASARAKKISNIRFTGFVSESQLRWLYEHCRAYVFPSLSEGFGLPGLEAMLHGAPVVSSNATCLPEIYGKAAHYFDPTDINDIAQKINEVLNDKELRSSLIKKGKQQAAKYSWQRTAKQTLKIYESVLKK